MTDQELLHSFVKEKTDAAFAELVRRHQDMVFSACFRRLGHFQHAQDAAQQTFLRLVLKAASLLNHSCLGGWLYRTANLEAGSLMKKEANRRKYEQVMTDQPISHQPTATDERLAGLDEAMLDLKNADRNALVLRFFEGRSLREVGEAFGSTEEAARKRVSRALEQLAGLMRERGATACTAVTLTTLLAGTTHAAPAALLPAVATAARHTLTAMEVASVTALTKVKITALSALIAAVPVAVQWRANSALREDNAALRKELTASRVQTTIVPAKPSPVVVRTPLRKPAPEKTAEPPGNPLGSALISLLSAEARQLDAAKQEKLTTALQLSEAQQQEAESILAAARQRRADGIARIASGKVTLTAVRDVLHADLMAADQFRVALTPAQVPAYEQFLAEETVDFTEASANAELSRLNSLLNLTETQKDQIFSALVGQTAFLTTLADETADSLATVRNRWEAMQEAEAEALAPLLDEPQRQAYASQAAVRRAFVAALLTEHVPGKVQSSAEFFTSRELTTVAGKPLTLPDPDPGTRATVLVFSSTTCPIANGFAPELQRIDADFREQGIRLVLVQTETDITAEAARRHALDYGLTCPVLTDPQRILAKAVGATITPEAAVLSPTGEILYRGRIDDRFPDVGQRRPAPHHTELRDAIAAILDGKPVPVSRTKAVGCFIE
jgi:RNA polymerase sigma factor (sigma-70 family)